MFEYFVHSLWTFWEVNRDLDILHTKCQMWTAIWSHWTNIVRFEQQFEQTLVSFQNVSSVEILGWLVPMAVLSPTHGQELQRSWPVVGLSFNVLERQDHTPVTLPVPPQSRPSSITSECNIKETRSCPSLKALGWCFGILAIPCCGRMCVIPTNCSMSGKEGHARTHMNSKVWNACDQ